jgi:hypothetical protein
MSNFLTDFSIIIFVVAVADFRNDGFENCDVEDGHVPLDLHRRRLVLPVVKVKPGANVIELLTSSLNKLEYLDRESFCSGLYYKTFLSVIYDFS